MGIKHHRQNGLLLARDLVDIHCNKLRVLLVEQWTWRYATTSCMLVYRLWLHLTHRGSVEDQAVGQTTTTHLTNRRLEIECFGFDS